MSILIHSLDVLAIPVAFAMMATVLLVKLRQRARALRVVAEAQI